MHLAAAHSWWWDIREYLLSGYHGRVCQKSARVFPLGIIVTYLKHASTEVLLTEQASRTPLNIQMNQDEHRSRCKSRATHSDGNVIYKMNERVGTRRCHCALDKHGKHRKNRKGTKVANRSRNREVTSSTRDDVMCGGDLWSETWQYHVPDPGSMTLNASWADWQRSCNIRECVKVL